MCFVTGTTEYLIEAADNCLGTDSRVLTNQWYISCQEEALSDVYREKILLLLCEKI